MEQTHSVVPVTTQLNPIIHHSYKLLQNESLTLIHIKIWPHITRPLKASFKFAKLCPRIKKALKPNYFPKHLQLKSYSNTQQAASKPLSLSLSASCHETIGSQHKTYSANE